MLGEYHFDNGSQCKFLGSEFRWTGPVLAWTCMAYLIQRREWRTGEDRQPLKKEWEKETLERWAINLVSGLARFAQMLRNSCRHYPVSLTGHSENLHSTARATLLLEENSKLAVHNEFSATSGRHHSCKEKLKRQEGIYFSSNSSYVCF